MERKKFNSIEEMVQYLENQMIKAKVEQYHLDSLALIDEAVLKSNLNEANLVIKHIMGLK